MPKLITGFLLGVLATLAVIHWTDRSAPNDSPGSSAESLAPDPSTRMQPASAENASSESVEDESGLSSETALAEMSVVDEPSATRDSATSAHPHDAGATTPVPKPPRQTTNDRYPPEIAEMIENRVDKELQARYENDAREESWATYMEGQLAAYFGQKPLLAQFYFSLIDCRTSMCSVHVLGYGPQALTNWNASTADLVSQPWFDFQSMSMNRRNPEPDILAIVLILTRKPAG